MQQKRKYEQIADLLMARLRSGEFKPGDRLPAERVLAKKYDVSRSVIREAVRSMEQIGCVESRLGGGSYVKIPDVSNIADPFSVIFEQDQEFARELIETRLILETHIARLAAQRRTEEQLKAMGQTLADMKAAMQRGESCEELDARFHEQLAQASGNRALSITISTYSEVVNRSIKLTRHMDDVSPEALEDHEKILSAVTQKDSRAAQMWMRQHLNNAQKNLEKARR